MAEAVERAVSMALRDWFLIDGTMDNAGQTALELSDDRGSRRARSIRETGWTVTGPLARTFSDSGSWPPPDIVMGRTITISLAIDDWRYIVSELTHWAAVSDVVGHAHDASWSRRLAARLAEEALNAEGA